MTAAIKVEVLSDLIGSIYDCVIDTDRWPSTLSQMRQILDFRNAAMHLMSLPTGETLLKVVDGVDAPWLDSMESYGADVIDQWGGAEKLQSLPLDEPAVLSWVNDRAHWEGNRYFTEWAVPQGIIDVMAIGLARNPAMLGSIGMGRHASAGSISEREVDAARLLTPHFQRAVAISKLFELKSVVAQTFRAALDTLTAAVILVDADLRIVDANRAGQTMLGAGDPIRADRGFLSVNTAAAARALAIAVRQASASETEIGRKGFGVPARSADGMPCVLHVLPLQHGSIRPGLAPAAAAAVFVAAAISPSPPPNEAMAVLFDLTATEARILSLVARGKTLAEAARELGVKDSTAKTHLLRVFDKTGTHRQSELIKLADSLAMPL